MKKTFLTVLSVLALAAPHTLLAQKYSTRAANVSFFSKTPMENIEAINHEANIAMNSKSGDIIAVVPIRSFKFKQELMQEHFNENYMESAKFPKAEFRGKVTSIEQVDFNKDGLYNVKSVGKLTIHGVTREVSLPGTITIKKGVATLNSSFPVKCAEYGIKIPTVVSSKVAETIDVTLGGTLTAAK